MLNSENFRQLKLDLSRQFGSPIFSVAALKHFQDAVEYTIGEKISYNTLRRFFGFLPETNPSKKTINSLSKYLGFKSYTAYTKAYANDVEWYTWKKVLQIELDPNISKEDIDWLSTQRHTYQFHMKLSNIIKSKIYRDELETIALLFDAKILEFEEADRLKFAAQICLLFRSLNEQSINKLIAILSPIISFRENVLHWFIDYSYLNGYYGKCIHESLKYAEDESHEQLFYKLLLELNKYLSFRGDLKEIPLSRIKKDFHPVLKGRCFGYNLIYFSTQNNTEKLEDTWSLQMQYLKEKKTDIFLFSIEILPALLILKDYKRIKGLFNTHYEELLKPTNWSGHTIHSIVLLAYCFQNLKENQIKEAKKSFELINTARFSDSYKAYAFIFYKIIAYHLETLQNAKQEILSDIEQDYLFYVEKTGFKLFTIHYLREFLKT